MSQKKQTRSIGAKFEEMLPILNASGNTEAEMIASYVKTHIFEHILKEKLQELKDASITENKRLGETLLTFAFSSFLRGDQQVDMDKALYHAKLGNFLEDEGRNYPTMIEALYHRVTSLTNEAYMNMLTEFMFNDDLEQIAEKANLTSLGEIFEFFSNLELFMSPNIYDKLTGDTIHMGTIIRASKEYQTVKSLLVGNITGILCVDTKRELYSYVFKYKDNIYNGAGTIYISIGLTLPLEFTELPPDFLVLNDLMKYVCATG